MKKIDIIRTLLFGNKYRTSHWGVQGVYKRKLF